MSAYVAGNRITLLRNGTEYFPALISAIEAAQTEIFIQTFIYVEDSTGEQIAQALRRAAFRGVKVHVLLDGFGSRRLDRQFVAEIQASGIQLLFYRPKISPWTLKRNRLRRLHHKLATIDAKVAFVGGINMIDDLNVPTGHGPRVDYAVKVEGPMLKSIHHRVSSLWRRTCWALLQPAQVAMTICPEPIAFEEGVLARFVVRDNLMHRQEIERAYIQAINDAKSEIIIANAYFIPGRKFRLALVRATARGVRVKLLLQGRMEYIWILATQAMYADFLAKYIEVYEYKASFMHSKVAVIDNLWATVGSSNIDPFSLLLAHEANVVVLDRRFAANLKADLLHAIAQGAKQIKAEDVASKGLALRLVSWLTYGFVRILVGLIGYPKH